MMDIDLYLQGRNIILEKELQTSTEWLFLKYPHPLLRCFNSCPDKDQTYRSSRPCYWSKSGQLVLL